MTSTTTRERVPVHLRRFVVEQDWNAYDAIDHAVWRFVLLQVYARLKDTAHPAYVEGLARTGMSVERIPRIAEMDACLSELGWGAVCVDGFIPPRAFFELQAHGILPIAADIRTPEHLAYTPAPDIIHEAGGHAPILPDPEYATFLRRIGEVGLRAFASPRDARIYDAIYQLSVVKERWDASEREVADAEQRLQALVEQREPPSEAALLSRLYWWTVEYGLVGTLDDYKLYGAGLLSSLGESHFCHGSDVRKLPLTPGCIEYDYDITRAQPQLFVARDFAQLGEVLDAVSRGFAQRRGGAYGLSVAEQSGETATIELDAGQRVEGEVEALVQRQGEPVLVHLPRAAVTSSAREPLHDGHLETLLLLGPLLDGSFVHQHTPEEVARRYAPEGRLRLSFQRGPGVEGQLRRAYALGDGGSGLLLLDGARVLDEAFELLPAGPLAIDAAGDALAVSAGGELGAQADTGYPDVRAPHRGAKTGERAALLSLYERAEASYRSGHCVAQTFRQVHEALARQHDGEWLLRWNLLESLSQLGLDAELQRTLVRELQQLERRYGGRYPIASGLRYLGRAVDFG